MNEPPNGADVDTVTGSDPTCAPNAVVNGATADAPSNVASNRHDTAVSGHRGTAND